MKKLFVAVAILLVAIVVYAAPAAALERESAVARLLPRTVVGTSWSGCGSARARALGVARRKCRSQGGLDWYEYDSCQASNAGLATIYMSFQCKSK
jgi:hypothetical protein